MKKMKKVMLIVLFLGLIILLTNKVNATSISASPSSPKKGQSVTITVTVPNVNTVDLTATVSGAGTSGTIRLVDGSITGSARTFSKSITVTPTSTGTIKVNISSGSNAVLNGEYVKNLITSKSINVSDSTSSSGSGNTGGNSSGGTSSKPSGGGNTSKPNNNTTTPTEKEKSKDSTLSALTVKEGAITPEFKKDIKEYALTIPYETSEVNVTATPTDSKATVAVEGNKDLKEGENTVTVKVTAEDGSTSNYVIKVTRKRVPVALKSLIIKYENQEGELIELPLNPTFGFDKLEYTLEDLEYWVEKLSIEAIPNIKEATVDIQGADSLQTGENTIIITVKVKAEDAKDVKEGEEPKEETITYTIKVNKKEEPTLMVKISNSFNNLWNNISTWFNQNTEKIILGALGVCVVALIGLSVYIIVDHNRYKDVIAKARMERKANKLNTNNTSENIIEEIHKYSNDTKKDNIDDNKNDKPKGGKHF